MDAVLKALTAYTERVHLILGGYDKGAEWDELVAATEGRVVEALLIGATAERLAAAFAARAGVGAGDGDPGGALRRPRRGASREAADGALAGRRRPAQPGLRELGPVQGLRGAGRTLHRARGTPGDKRHAVTSRRGR